MKTTSKFKPAAAQRPNTKIAANATSQKRPQFRKAASSGFHRPDARNPQSAQRNYERYLALARAETLAGDRIAAENYLQHAEHYLRSMGENSN
ncbi:MAG TPA: DUF4167 domain-containing protein [Phyllobacterium sp.]|nr:DUF4167 domain-containing protein [Phyllobacterium sp.]